MVGWVCGARGRDEESKGVEMTSWQSEGEGGRYQEASSAIDSEDSERVDKEEIVG